MASPTLTAAAESKLPGAGLARLPWLKQVLLMVGIAASVAIGMWAVLWTQTPDYQPLYGSLEHLDAAEVAEVLRYHNIKFTMDPGSGALLVPSGDLARARLKLAEAGLPATRAGQGFELLDQEQPLGTSQFMENARYKRSLEGELARTISSINAVRSARVHLAIPKASVFVRDGRKPSASVFLELYPGRSLEPHQKQGIANLVASSIPELTASNVTLVDQKGALISLGEEDERLAEATRQLDYTRKVEGDIAARVARLLTPILGPDNFKIEVAAAIDFTEIEQAAETFNPDLSLVRSESTVEERQVGGALAGGIPGALSNQPPAAGAAPEVAEPEAGTPRQAEPPGNKRAQATRNFELDRTLSFTKHQKGRLERLSVAVVIDHKNVAGAEAVERVAWTEAELQRLSTLVRDAVGFSAQRGDSVNVLNEPFFATEPLVIPPEPWWERREAQFIAKQLAGVAIVVALLLGLVRPLFRNLRAAGAEVQTREEAAALAALEASGAGLGGLGEDTVTLTGGNQLSLPRPEESYEEQLASIKGLVTDDAARVAQVIKRWINEE